MKKIIYSALIAVAGLGLAACNEVKDVYEMDMMDGIEMVVRSVSVEDGTTVRPLEYITVDYNNLVGIDKSKTATLNGEALEAYINPDNGMQLVVNVNTKWNTDYTFEIPAGMIYRRDDASVTNGGVTVNFNTHGGADKAKLDKKLTNAAASAEAVALYNQLMNDYGVVMYSGAMGGVAWETTYTDYISANNEGAGYPKVVGFDYIHLAYSPANWIDYGDITPVKQVWDAGSIPAITWHWNVPNSMDGITKPEDRNVNDLNAKSTGFSLERALTAGTPENAILEADIKKLAGYMKLLADAKIPVLFRPLHEAAGDFSWGAWFWWGMSGTDATKQLWSLLRQRLESDYGINNLIWVWTMDTSDAGQFASIERVRDAYPGNDNVDIVGADIYPALAMTDQTETFTFINNVVEGKKIVALSEIGNLVDPATAAENNALWSWFMNWYDYDGTSFYFREWNTQKVTVGDTEYANPWAAVANSPYVLNRK